MPDHEEENQGGFWTDGTGGKVIIPALAAFAGAVAGAVLGTG